MPKQYDLLEILDHIDPAALNYQEWCSVGMALHHAGHTAADWDAWSQRDPNRYHRGECFKKWDSFHGSPNPVTAGTVVQLARDQGWRPERDEGHELDWDDVIGARDDYVIIDKHWVEEQEVTEPGDDWDPAGQLIKYLETLFEATDNVGYVTESWHNKEKDEHMPTKGSWDRTAGQLIEQLATCKGDIGSVIGDCKPEVGAWIRFNPLDGEGCKNANVADHRFALVESDDMEIDKQNAIIRELELPVACLVHSGKRSLHAIVRVDAPNYDEYRKRVDYLYEVCRKNGLQVDPQNRNPSRLSRMPGITRNGAKQFLVDTNIGKSSWTEWQEWIEAVSDDLPEPEALDSVWDDLPDLSPPLIDGVLRQGHKMLLAGPSKAGKSFALIQLCIAIAEGRPWLSWPCAKGRVMYVNLELDRASCLHRFRDVYQALGWQPEHLRNIDIWNLRGRSVPMDKLAPKLIRRAQKKDYIAIVIDPIYKVITGDENSADQMAHFCNQFDLVCHELNAAVIYCHHHSKGHQGQKRSMDRASGSGVFARDPDALLDYIELSLDENLLKLEEGKAVCAVCARWLNDHAPGWSDDVPGGDQHDETKMLGVCQRTLGDQYHDLLDDVYQARQRIKQRTAWRVEGTLREFPRFQPANLWFDYPTHQMDDQDLLKDAQSESEKAPWERAKDKRKPKAIKAEERKKALETAYQACGIGDTITLADLAEFLGVTERTVRNRIKEHGGFEVDNGLVIQKKKT